MNRPTRTRFAFAAFWAVCLVLGNVLPSAARAPFVVLILGLAGLSYFVSREFFVGRRHLKKKRWVDAITAFQQFEKELEGSPWKRRLSWLAGGVYTRDPVALARNNIGVIHLENGKLELAETAFRAAIARDVDYAVPRLNLAVIAAKRGDKNTMEAELAEAQRLGLTQKRAHEKVRAALGT